jgi:photosystem II oxygen-evolving enhancer protein 3
MAVDSDLTQKFVTSLLVYQLDSHLVSLFLLQSNRRDVLAKVAAGAAFVPALAANAAAGESPRFSVFGLLGDGTSYSEGAAFGSDQSSPLYSPYSVYGNEAGSLYNPSNPEYADRKKATIAETKKRLAKMPEYIARKEWFNVTDELRRYMYETRGAVKGLAVTKEQKKAANDFFLAVNALSEGARVKSGAQCTAGADASVATLDAFLATL